MTTTLALVFCAATFGACLTVLTLAAINAHRTGVAAVRTDRFRAVSPDDTPAEAVTRRQTEALRRDWWDAA